MSCCLNWAFFAFHGMGILVKFWPSTHVLPSELLLGIFTIIERELPNLIFRKHQHKVNFNIFNFHRKKCHPHYFNSYAKEGLHVTWETCLIDLEM